MTSIKTKSYFVSLLTQIPHLYKFFQCRADRSWFSCIIFQQYFSFSLPLAKYLIKHVDHDLITDERIIIADLFPKMNDNTNGSACIADCQIIYQGIDHPLFLLLTFRR